MADILGSVVSEVLLNKLISIALEEINGVWGVKDDLKKLQRTLVSIKAHYVDVNWKFKVAFQKRAVVEKVSNDMFLKLSCLRVLDLSHTEIQKLPPSIGKLKHLRYFDASHTYITTLPDSFTSLYNLQTLRLKCCYNFEEFPKYMRKLVNLRYLTFSGTYTWAGSTLAIREVGKLSQLQKLTKFFVGKNKGFGIEELKGLNFLGGKLEIHNLENVRDAMGANLKEKQYICCLKLYWSDSCNVEDEYAVLEGLQPHQNLKRLIIYGFPALKFPTWMTSTSSYCLPNLISITLQDCRSCEHLPALGQLPFLKFLKIEGLLAVKCIGSEFYRSNEQSAAIVALANISFPSLEELYLDGMSNLEEWLGDRLSSPSSFPCLKKLEIRTCFKLKITPTLFPSLKTLYSEDQNGVSLMSMVASNLASLTFIHIYNCKNLKFLPQVLLQGNTVLRRLEIVYCEEFEAFIANQDQEEQVQVHEVLSNNNSLYEISIRYCDALKSVPDLWGLNSLRILKITRCGSLKSLPDGIQCLPALEEMSIGPFSEELESFQFPAIREGNQQYFASLHVLRIHGWSSLKSLPEQLQYLTSLQELVVDDIPSLVALPEWLGNLASLQTLDIHWCKNLMYLPSQEQMLRLTALQKLEIGACPLLEKRCCSVDGDEAHKTAHIPKRVDRFPFHPEIATQKFEVLILAVHTQLQIFHSSLIKTHHHRKPSFAKSFPIISFMGNNDEDIGDLYTDR
ncbi:Leucine rich repeat 4 [Macleaya cordata]|uniref:Leucine rich repeat 4 n=1 Tax=Macleaya cordata TaxID=56857 RepID=A0A200QJR0_MACCD|nr:Leucine rich repeat 4 [Macleaya cordata]